MKKFSELGIKTNIQSFMGDKIKMDRILNREIVVHDFRIEDSKYTEKCLYMQISIGQTKHVVFTGSKNLRETIQQIPKDGFPFTTTIIREAEYFTFT